MVNYPRQFRVRYVVDKVEHEEVSLRQFQFS